MDRPTVIKPEPDVESAGKKKSSLVFPGLTVPPFIMIVACFAAWGVGGEPHGCARRRVPAHLPDVELPVGARAVRVLRRVLRAGHPGGLINKRFGYKVGVLTGLGLATVGGFLFIPPAGRLLEYGFFLIALFVLAAGGLSILETSANPFVISMGPPERSATQRLNLAQAFNPVGANIGGVLLGAVLILPNITPEPRRPT